jgi:hypothetical protein
VEKRYPWSIKGLKVINKIISVFSGKEKLSGAQAKRLKASAQSIMALLNFHLLTGATQQDVLSQVVILLEHKLFFITGYLLIQLLSIMLVWPTWGCIYILKKGRIIKQFL